MKKKQPIIAIILIVIAVILMGSAAFIIPRMSENENINEEPSIKNDTPEEIQKTYNSLFEIANDMYDNNTYLNLEKDIYGNPYLTIGEYKSMGYDLKFIDTSCPDKFQFIYFDIVNKDNYEDRPVLIMESCEGIPVEDEENLPQ